MKGTFTLASLCCISSALFAQNGTGAVPSPAPTAATTTGTPTKIGVINVQLAIVNTNEGKRDFDALEKKFEPKRVELKKSNDEVDELKKQLQAQSDHLNDEERNKRVQTIEQKSKALQRNLEDAQSDFQTQQNELANRIGTKMLDVVDKYARANGIGVIIDVSGQASPVLWASETVNITQGVVDAYNATSGVAAPAATSTGTGATTIPRSGTTGTTTRPPVTSPVTTAPRKTPGTTTTPTTPR